VSKSEKSKSDPWSLVNDCVDQQIADALLRSATMRRDYYGWFLPYLTDAQLEQLAPRRIRELCDALGITGTIQPRDL